MEKSGAMYSWEAFWERGFITVSAVGLRYLTEKIHYLKKRLKKFREMTTIKLNKLRKRKKPEESEKEHEKN